MNTTDKIADVFDKFVAPEPNSGCWLWTGHVNNAGYGMLTRRAVSKSPMLAHRFMFSVVRGPIPHGAEIDHKCRTRCCVNPDHLEAVSRLENVRRAVPFRPGPYKQTCPKGHPYSGENLMIKSNGRRHCRECSRAQFKSWYYRRAA